MKVERVSTPPGAPVRPSGQRRGEPEATVSDRRIRLGPQERPASEGRAAGVQVTSNPRLQQVLSPEEIQALLRQFATAPATDAAPGQGRLNVYNGRGAAQQAPSGKTHGRLVDVTA
jgi:hypothetical protein